MLPSKIDTLLTFQPPTRQLLQQQDIHNTAKKYYDLFAFTDNALAFLKRYLTENFSFLSYFDQSSVLLIQTCHNFHAAWPKLHQDSSPLVSVLLLQLQNTLSMASSLTPMEFRVEDETREVFLKKINAIKDIQQSIDKKFQTLWKQCHTQTSAYYQKLEEYKEEVQKVRHRREKHEKEIRDAKGYNINLVRELETKLNEKVSVLEKAKEAFDLVCKDSQDSYRGIITFFEVNKELIEEFLKMFLRTLMEMTVFLVEKMKQNFVQLKQTTSEVLQIVKRVNPKGSWEAEDRFMNEFFLSHRQETEKVKEISRINHYRQEFVNAVGFVFQESLHLCQESVEKYTYFEEADTFKDFFSQFDSKISLNLLPFAELLKDLKTSFGLLFNGEKINTDKIIHQLSSQRFKAYSVLIAALSKTSHKPSHQANQIDLNPVSQSGDQSSQEAIKKAVSDFLQVEEGLAREFVKDLERLYTVMNQEIWSKMIQVCQKVLLALKENAEEDKLTVVVRSIRDNLVHALGNTESIEQLETRRSTKTLSTSRKLSDSTAEENVTSADERTNTSANKIDRHGQNAFKFIKEKKAESLADYVKKQHEGRLKEINPNPYSVEFEKEKVSLATDDNEVVLDSFACAFVDKMLLQGRIYITSAKIVFKSYFNGRTLFGNTVLFIPLKDIVSVVKKNNVLGIKNMIEITTRKGTLSFTSFVFRDQAFDLIEKIMKTMHPRFARNLDRDAQAAVKQDEEPLEEECEAHEEVASTENAASRKLRRQKKMEMEHRHRNKAILKEMPALSKYENLGFKYNYPIDFNVFFRVLLSNTPINYKGKDYSCCWEIMEAEQGTYDLKIGEWNKEFPKDVTKKKDLLGYKTFLERHIVGRKKLDVPVPFAPKNFQFNQQNKLFFVNEKEVVLILEVDTPDKLPLSDTFKFRTCYILKNETGEDGNPCASMSFNYYADWYKSTILKNVIVKAAKEERKNTGVNMDKIVKELINTGVFEKMTKQVEEEKQAEGNNEEEDELEEANIEVGNNGDIEDQEAMELETEKEGETVGTMLNKQEVDGQTSGFKVSKRILFIYFSVSLVLFTFVFTRLLFR